MIVPERDVGGVDDWQLTSEPATPLHIGPCPDCPKREAALMRRVLEAEKFDQKFGLQLPGDSALAVIFGGFEETLARMEGEPDA